MYCKSLLRVCLLGKISVIMIVEMEGLKNMYVYNYMERNLVYMVFVQASSSCLF